MALTKEQGEELLEHLDAIFRIGGHPTLTEMIQKTAESMMGIPEDQRGPVLDTVRAQIAQTLAYSFEQTSAAMQKQFTPENIANAARSYRPPMSDMDVDLKENI